MKSWKKALSLAIAFMLCIGSTAYAATGSIMDNIKNRTAGGNETDELPDISAYVGSWKTADEPYYLVISDAGEWCAIDLYGEETGPGFIVAGEEGIALYTEYGYERTSLRPTGDGNLVDSDGNALAPVEDIVLLPTPEDELTQTAYFPDDFQDVSISYPIQMSAGPHPSVNNAVSLNAVMEDGTDDYYTNILLAFQPISGYDSYMKKGASTAQKYMKTMLNDFMDSMYGDYIIKKMEFEFADNGDYYSMTGSMWLDSTIFSGGELNQPVLSRMEVRYYGPTDYAFVALTTALESRFQNYVDICDNILATLSYDTGWRTSK